jgi:hypothetical protein
MTKYIGNAFSLQMLNNFPIKINVKEVSKAEALAKDNVSVVGHQDTANVLGVPCNRVSLTLDVGDILYVAQVIGGRLPEGCTKLPENFKMKFFKITID